MFLAGLIEPLSGIENPLIFVNSPLLTACLDSSICFNIGLNLSLEYFKTASNSRLASMYLFDTLSHIACSGVETTLKQGCFNSRMKQPCVEQAKGLFDYDRLCRCSRNYLRSIQTLYRG